MEKETVLEIEFQTIFDKWGWRVIKQNEVILKRGVFRDSDIDVVSCSFPNYYEFTGVLYIRGDDEEKDNLVNICTEETKRKIEIKVRNINEKYGIKKRWRAEKEGFYYFIDTKGNVAKEEETNSFTDDKLYEYGNYFQTYEEASKYRYKIKKMLTNRELEEE